MSRFSGLRLTPRPDVVFAAHPKKGIRTVDVGAPMLSMHSVREMCGTDDVTYAIAHFKSVLQNFSSLDAQLDAVDSIVRGA